MLDLAQSECSNFSPKDVCVESRLATTTTKRIYEGSCQSHKTIRSVLIDILKFHLLTEKRWRDERIALQT